MAEGAHAARDKSLAPLSAYSGVYLCYGVLILFEGRPSGRNYLPGYGGYNSEVCGLNVSS